MAAKVFESIGKLGLGLAVAGGVVNSALYNGEWEKPGASSSLGVLFCRCLGCSARSLLTASGEPACSLAGLFQTLHKREDCEGLSLEGPQVAAALVSRAGGPEPRLPLPFALLLPGI